MFVFLLMLNFALAKPQEKAMPTLEVCATVNHIEALQEERSEIERALATMPVSTSSTNILGEDVWEATLSAMRSHLIERKNENKQPPGSTQRLQKTMRACSIARRRLDRSIANIHST